ELKEEEEKEDGDEGEERYSVVLGRAEKGRAKGLGGKNEGGEGGKLGRVEEIEEEWEGGVEIRGGTFKGPGIGEEIGRGTFEGPGIGEEEGEGVGVNLGGE
ncbi:17960_t:CDS:1, partial [Funneliformis geosporum]